MKALMFQSVRCTPHALSHPYGSFRTLGAWFPSHPLSSTNDTKAYTMTPAKRYAKKHAKAMQRRRLSAKERHEHQQRKAQRAIDALHQALHDVGWPDDLVLESEGRLRSQSKLLGKIFALMFPPLFGC